MPWAGMSEGEEESGAHGWVGKRQWCCQERCCGYLGGDGKKGRMQWFRAKKIGTHIWFSLPVKKLMQGWIQPWDWPCLLNRETQSKWSSCFWKMDVSGQIWLEHDQSECCMSSCMFKIGSWRLILSVALPGVTAVHHLLKASKCSGLTFLCYGFFNLLLFTKHRLPSWLQCSPVTLCVQKLNEKAWGS